MNEKRNYKLVIVFISLSVILSMILAAQEVRADSGTSEATVTVVKHPETTQSIDQNDNKKTEASTETKSGTATASAETKKNLPKTNETFKQVRKTIWIGCILMGISMIMIIKLKKENDV